MEFMIALNSKDGSPVEKLRRVNNGVECELWSVCMRVDNVIATFMAWLPVKNPACRAPESVGVRLTVVGGAITTKKGTVFYNTIDYIRRNRLDLAISKRWQLTNRFSFMVY